VGISIRHAEKWQGRQLADVDLTDRVDSRPCWGDAGAVGWDTALALAARPEPVESAQQLLPFAGRND